MTYVSLILGSLKLIPSQQKYFLKINKIESLIVLPFLTSIYKTAAPRSSSKVCRSSELADLVSDLRLLVSETDVTGEAEVHLDAILNSGDIFSLT